MRTYLARLLQEARSRSEFQRVQCVWLRAALGLSAPQIATALGWRADYVRHVQAAYLRQGAVALRDKPQGGRRHENLTREQEQQLFAPLLAQAQAGGLLIVAPVQAAYEQTVGRPVHPSVVYRALHRQGWRKVAPRPQHPQANAEARETFKKSCPTWSPKRSRNKPR